MSVAVLLCGRCGSHHVDVRGWRSHSVAELACSDCQHVSPVAGFTVGRVWRDDEPEIVTAAIADAALPTALAVR
jgi:hypothetical protein